MRRPQVNLMKSPWARMAVPVAVLGLAITLSSCGASFDSGVASPTPSVASQAAVTPSPSASACVNPSTTADYTLAGATTLSGNLQEKNITVGTGKAAKEGDTVSVTYVGKLSNGTVFDNQSSSSISLKIAAGSVIEGWVEGIPGMKVGGRRELVIPPALGYGCESPSSKIPVNSTLVFTINLTGVS
jgi:FKBP-type peptidyl-prolyl cis-trans isomerase